MSDTVTKLFISYSRKDRSTIEPLYGALNAHESLRVIRDTDDILPTEEWKPRLEKLIRESDTILFALSPHSATSEVCSWELELADSLNKRVIPVVVENVDGAVPELLAKLNYIFLTPQDDFAREVAKIRDAINLDIDWIREHTRIAELADRWDKAARLGAAPMRGRELAAAESWLVEQPKEAPQATEIQRRFILESRRAATKRQRMTVVVSLAGLVLVGALGVFSWIQRGAAIEGQRAAQDALTEMTTTANFLVRDLASDDVRPDVPTASYQSVLNTAIDLQTNAAKRSAPSGALALGQAQAFLSLAGYGFAQADYPATQKQAEAALEIFQATDWPEDQRVLARFNQASAHLLLARALFNQGESDRARTALTAAEQQYMRAREITDRENPDHLQPYGRFANALADFYAQHFLRVEDIHVATANIAVQAFRRVLEKAPTPAVQKQLARSLYTYAYLMSDGDSGEIADTFQVDPTPDDAIPNANADGLAALTEAQTLIETITAGDTPTPVSLATIGDIHFLTARYALRDLRNKDAAAGFAAAAVAYETAFARRETDTAVFDRYLRAKEFEGIAWLRDDEPFKALLAALQGKRGLQEVPRDLRAAVRGGSILDPIVSLGQVRSGVEERAPDQSWAAYLALQERREVEFAIKALSADTMTDAKWAGKKTYIDAFDLMRNGKYAEGAALVDQSVATLKPFVDIFEFRCIASLSIVQNLSLKYIYLPADEGGRSPMGDQVRVQLEMEPYQNNCRSIVQTMEDVESTKFTLEELEQSLFFGSMEYVLRDEFAQAQELLGVMVDRGMISSNVDLLRADVLMFQGNLDDSWAIHTSNRDLIVDGVAWVPHALDSLSFWRENGMQSPFMDEMEQRLSGL